MNEIECSYDCPVRSQCVHSTVKSESHWHPKYIGRDGCIHFKQIQPHFEKGRWVESFDKTDTRRKHGRNY